MLSIIYGVDKRIKNKEWNVTKTEQKPPHNLHESRIYYNTGIGLQFSFSFVHLINGPLSSIYSFLKHLESNLGFSCLIKLQSSKVKIHEIMRCA